MKALRTLRALTVLSTTSRKARLNPTLFHRFYSAQPQEDDPTTAHDFGTNNSVFDSSQYSVPDIDLHDSDKNSQQPTWDEKYRARADRMIFGEETQKRKLRVAENEDEERRRALAKALLQAALEKADDEVGEGEVKEEYQKSLNVGIIGAPNAGKSSLTNFLVCFFSKFSSFSFVFTFFFVFGLIIFVVTIIYSIEDVNFEFSDIDAVLSLEYIINTQSSHSLFRTLFPKKKET